MVSHGRFKLLISGIGESCISTLLLRKGWILSRWSRIYSRFIRPGFGYTIPPPRTLQANLPHLNLPSIQLLNPPHKTLTNTTIPRPICNPNTITIVLNVNPPANKTTTQCNRNKCTQPTSVSVAQDTIPPINKLTTLLPLADTPRHHNLPLLNPTCHFNHPASLPRGDNGNHSFRCHRACAPKKYPYHTK